MAAMMDPMMTQEGVLTIDETIFSKLIYFFSMYITLNSKLNSINVKIPQHIKEE